MISINPPTEFGGENDALTILDKSSQRLFFIMEQAGVSNPKELSTYEFYAKVDFIEEQNRQK